MLPRLLREAYYFRGYERLLDRATTLWNTSAGPAHTFFRLWPAAYAGRMATEKLSVHLLLSTSSTEKSASARVTKASNLLEDHDRRLNISDLHASFAHTLPHASIHNEHCRFRYRRPCYRRDQSCSLS